MIIQAILMPILTILPYSYTARVNHSEMIISRGTHDRRISSDAGAIVTIPDMDSCINLMLVREAIERFDHRATDLVEYLVRMKAASKYEDIKSLVSDTITILTTVSVLIAVPIVTFSLYHILHHFPYFEPGCCD